MFSGRSFNPNLHSDVELADFEEEFDEDDVSILFYWLILEVTTGQVPADASEYRRHLVGLHQEAKGVEPMLVEVSGEAIVVLEVTRRKMCASVLEPKVHDVAGLLSFVRTVKPRLHHSFWLCKLYKILKKEEVKLLHCQEDVHASLAEIVERVYRQGGREATVELVI